MDIRINGSVIYSGRYYSNDELCNMQKFIVNKLSKLSLQKDEVVAFSMKRSPWMLCSIFAMLELHIPFLPIDITQAKQRVSYILKDAGVNKILLDEESSKILEQEKYEVQGIVLYEQEEQCIDEPGEIIRPYTSEEDIAYVLYTSGSTGLPKGVEVLWSGLINFLTSVPTRVAFPNQTRIACLTSFVFDIFFLESVMALQEGFEVVLASDKERSDPGLVIKMILDNQVNVIQMTPSAIQWIAMIDTKLTSFQNLKVILVGGEDWNGGLHHLLQQKTSAKLYNMYGPTETTIWSSIGDVTDCEELDMGQPIDQTQLYILDDHYQAVKQGELYISGAGLARGYRNAKALTEAAFVLLPGKPSVRAYRTGDFVRERMDGSIQYIGRIDQQIKIHGHRVELGEIEEIINSLKDIKASCVCYDQEHNNGEIICFYLANEQLDEAVLLDQLKWKIPQYMIPKRMVYRRDFLYTESQKIDRKGMLKDYSDRMQLKIHHVEQSEVGLNTKQSIAQSIMEVMGEILRKDSSEFKETVPMEDYALDSFGYVKLIVELEDKFGIRFGSDALTSESYKSIHDLQERISELLIEKETSDKLQVLEG